MFSLEKCAYRNLFFFSLQQQFTGPIYTDRKKKKSSVFFFLRATTFVASVIPSHMLHNQVDPHHSTTRKRRKHAIFPRLVNTENTQHRVAQSVSKGTLLSPQIIRKKRILLTPQRQSVRPKAQKMHFHCLTCTHKTQLRVNILIKNVKKAGSTQSIDYKVFFLN